MEHPAESFGKLGNHAEILYEDVHLGAEALLGDAGAGFLIAQHRLGPGRIHHCMRWLGVSRRAFDMLCERATYRRAQGSVLGDKQTVQNWIADSAAQMQGALGYSTDMPLEAMYRYARAARFYDGPDEVHRQSVARQILRGYEPPPDEVPSEHVPTRRAAAREKFAEILEAVTAND